MDLKIRKQSSGIIKLLQDLIFYLTDIIIIILFYLEKLFLILFQDFQLFILGYILINILINYPPREIGITP